MSKYNDYLKSDKWRELRLSVLERDKYTCRECGAKNKLHIHHLKYDNVFNEPLEDLIVLCEKCHSLIHKIKESPKAPKKVRLIDKRRKGHAKKGYKLRKYVYLKYNHFRKTYSVRFKEKGVKYEIPICFCKVSKQGYKKYLYIKDNWYKEMMYEKYLL